MRRIYLDTCIVLSLLETSPITPPWFLSLYTARDVELFTSEIALVECLIQPLQTNNKKEEKNVELFFANPNLTCIGSSIDFFAKK